MNWTYKSNNQNGVRSKAVRVITPPGMRLKKDPSFAELEHWRGMHQNKFFNQNRLVTDKDVADSLRATMGNVRTKASSPNPYVILCDSGKSTKSQTAQDFHAKAIARNVNDLIPVRKCERNASSPLKCMGNEVIDMKTIRKAIEDFKPKIDLRLRRYIDPSRPNSPLLRRPVPSNTYCDIPVLDMRPRYVRHMTSPTSTASFHSQYSYYSSMPKDLDSWRRHSLTTLQKDDPMDPDSFYNKHYPLLLKQVPRRRKSAIPEDEVDEYRPMSKTPDIDMDFFDDLPAGPMPSDISCSESEEENPNHDIDYATKYGVGTMY